MLPSPYLTSHHLCISSEGGVASGADGGADGGGDGGAAADANMGGEGGRAFSPLLCH